MQNSLRRGLLAEPYTSRAAWLAFVSVLAVCNTAAAQGDGGNDAAQISAGELLRAGGVIGVVIMALSVAMLALIVEHILSLRKNTLIPPGMADAVREHIGHRQLEQARSACSEEPSLLGHILTAGLTEAGLGYAAVEKAMEDAAAEQSARLHRKIEYLSIIGTIAPMLGLMGTVWGMIQAFLEFESKANPQVSELAPGIYKALVTTLLGLGVAVPALASYAIFRNRIDELVAQASLTSEQVVSILKRATVARRKKSATHSPVRSEQSADESFVPADPEESR